MPRIHQTIARRIDTAYWQHAEQEISVFPQYLAEDLTRRTTN
jgi:hypothetical protein